MPTKLSRFCDGIMEAAWMAAVVLIPVFFNIYSSRIFEPDKITILRSLALVVLGAWLVKVVDEGGLRWRERKPGQPFWKYLWGVPLAAPVMGLMAIYLISTIFSVTPRVSLVGSYQRLQGTYTTFSYLVIFSAIAGNLRKRSQAERLVTTVILASLPVALYGVLQRYQIDPVPWGGNVSRRIASNMGNSIFVAAYLIMVFPLTAGRIVSSFRSILNEEKRLAAHVVRASIYIFIAALQLVALYMSGSRGPALGWMAGTYFLALLLSLYWRKRWLSVVSVAIAVFGAAFLIVFNIDNGPLQALRTSPAIGRFGLLLDPESNTALVRQYIWEGARKLTGFHPPLVYPDGSTDKFNFLRPLLGYGPESMYVAFNQFYTPELGHVERRNASPDRSHNETWDSVVITGLLGLAAYLFVFGSVFYYGLKWLGLIHTVKQRSLFLGLFLGGGLAGLVGLSLWRGVEYMGVGLPFGILVGVVIYLTAVGLFASFAPETSEKSNVGALLLIVLLSAIVGHFVEINFGIAIVSTRTLFWTYAGLLLVVGYILPRIEAEEAELAAQNAGEGETPDRKRGKKGLVTVRRLKSESVALPFLGDQPAWVRQAMIGVFMVSLVLVTLGFDFVTNPDRSTSVLGVIWEAMTRLPNKDNAVSYGVLVMILTTWLISALLVVSEIDALQDRRSWWRGLGITLGASLGVILLYWLWHAVQLVGIASAQVANQYDVLRQVGRIGGLLGNFYLYLFLMMLGAALFLPETWPARSSRESGMGVVLFPVMAVVVIVLVYLTNLRVIRADITFKMAEPFTKNGQWDVATFLYQEALKLTPREDHYYLFLGRSYLEQAKKEQDAAKQEELVLKAESDLRLAQEINPLNTDHTANLARLYTWWAGKASDGATRMTRALKASDYYATAVELSPYNSTLWGEWATLLLNLMRRPDEAYQKLLHALEIDQKYSYTQGLMGDYYLSIARSATDEAKRREAYEQALFYYGEAVRVATNKEKTSKVTYLVSQGNVYIELANLTPQTPDPTLVARAIEVYSQAVELGPTASDLYRIEEILAKLYVQQGDKENALLHARAALEAAPEAQKERIQALLNQIEALP